MLFNDTEEEVTFVPHHWIFQGFIRRRSELGGFIPANSRLFQLQHLPHRWGYYKCRVASPTLDLLDQNLHFRKISRICMHIKVWKASLRSMLEETLTWLNQRCLWFRNFRQLSYLVSDHIENLKLVMVEVFTWWKLVNTLYQAFRVLFWFQFFGSLFVSPPLPWFSQTWSCDSAWTLINCMTLNNLLGISKTQFPHL